MIPHLIGVTGVPGEGKSHLLRSARDLGKTAVCLTDPKEASFYGKDATLIWDEDWRPHKAAEGLKADGWLRLLKWTEERQTDDSKFVVYDTGSDATRLAEHEYLKLKGVFSPGDLEYGRGYSGTETLIHGLITEWQRLVVRGKTVLVSFHGVMKELEGAGATTAKKAMTGEVVEKFAEKLLPNVTGRNLMAQTIGSKFDLWLYTVPQGYDSTVALPPAAAAKAKRQYFVTAVADDVRPAKHSVTFKAGVNAARLPNTVKDLLSALDESA